ncbi:MAG: hypothetical protein ABL971_11885 [Vicinamibacterales bacterium]
MVIVRNVFRLKFGKTKEAVAVLKEGLEIQRKALSDVEFSARILTDVTGPFYTLVLEITVPNFAAFESNAGRVFADKDWQANYQTFSAMVESGYREVLSVAG